jgi:hypothetical protein
MTKRVVLLMKLLPVINEERAMKQWYSSNPTRTILPVSIFCLVLCAIHVPAAVSQCRQDVYHDGEILRYAVRWSFFRLGTVEVHQRLIDVSTNRYEILMKVRSTPQLPFISVNFNNQSEQLSHTHVLRREIVTTMTDTMVYRRLGNGERYVTEDRSYGTVLRHDTVITPEPVFDALSLFMVTRCLSATTFDTTFATLLNHACQKTDVRTTQSRASITVDAFDDPVPAVAIEGYGHWVDADAAGMTGAFTGWVSDDERALPLRAELEIFLGSIVLELEQFERTDTALLSSTE